MVQAEEQSRGQLWTDWRDPAQSPGYYAALEDADRILEKQGIRDQGWFESSLEGCFSLSIGEALESDNFLHRALAVLDRRMGKRRLRSLAAAPDEHPLVRQLLEVRQKAEGLGVREAPPE
jgi:hypothetical protein